jgi:hypothetical protein
MTERVDDPAQPPPVLVPHLGRWRGPSRHGLAEHRVRIAHHQERPAGGAADGTGAGRGPFGPPGETQNAASPIPS